MSNVTLTVCSFSIETKQKNGDTGIRSLNRFNKDINTCNIIKDFYDMYSLSYENYEEKEKIFSCTKDEVCLIEDSEYTSLWGRVKTGDYGIQSELVNINSGDTVYNKTPEIADVMPFYFLIYIPKDYLKDEKLIEVQKGILILQNNGQYGIKTVFSKYLEKYFMENYSSKLNISNVLPMVYINKLFESGHLKRIRLIKNRKSDDKSDNVGFDCLYEERAYIKPIVKENFTARVLDCIRRGNPAQIIEVDGFDYDNVKIEIGFNGITKTININNADNLIITENVPPKYIGADGHPLYLNGDKKPFKENFLDYSISVAKSYACNMALNIV